MPDIWGKLLGPFPDWREEKWEMTKHFPPGHRPPSVCSMPSVRNLPFSGHEKATAASTGGCCSKLKKTRADYQLDLVTPGIMPETANSRKVRREILKRRI